VLSRVYQPSEDSFFLLKVVERIRAAKVAEVGIGSGFVIHEYVKANSPDIAVGTDLDIEALKIARDRNGREIIDHVLCLSCDPFREGSFQMVFFNPPYLRDEDAEDLATSGGREGFERTYEMACSSYEALVDHGCMVFLASNLSNLESLLQKLRREGKNAVQLVSLKLFFEELYAFKVTKELVSQKSL
jgi:methylase of polypeptide subunit release factors